MNSLGNLPIPTTKRSEWKGSEAAWVAGARISLLAVTLNRLNFVLGTISGPTEKRKTCRITSTGGGPFSGGKVYTRHVEDCRTYCDRFGAKNYACRCGFDCTWFGKNQQLAPAACRVPQKDGKGFCWTSGPFVVGAVIKPPQLQRFQILQRDTLHVTEEVKNWLKLIGGATVVGAMFGSLLDTSEALLSFLTAGAVKSATQKTGLQMLHQVLYFEDLVWGDPNGTTTAATLGLMGRTNALLKEAGSATGVGPLSKRPKPPELPSEPYNWSWKDFAYIGIGAATLYIAAPFLMELGRTAADALKKKRTK